MQHMGLYSDSYSNLDADLAYQVSAQGLQPHAAKHQLHPTVLLLLAPLTPLSSPSHPFGPLFGHPTTPHMVRACCS